MELSIDRERCVGAGMCALTAPDVFDQDPEDGRVPVSAEVSLAAFPAPAAGGAQLPADGSGIGCWVLCQVPRR
ncbi:ferredoxin [Streptomyces silvisoli]|uniref:Ferredoxin n=1 Tax=Streptomyces silvisoli TaxID=3034235 RepID=A0ABT5ZED6_9ACTN|nr:ferredoxin [Streptomyces silvisoli]MDF3288193.1 ferredoxin [Streptomyces silvisoli]